MTDVSHTKPLTLGDLIDALEKAPPDAPVEFDFCRFVPTRLESYRGIYSELAFNYSRDTVRIVRHVLDECRQAVGKTFTGYKGGEYRMDRTTRVYVDNTGEATQTIITGVEVDSDASMVVLKTGKADW